MQRLASLDAPGVLHQMIIQDIDRRRIFKDSKDQNDFFARFKDPKKIGRGQAKYGKMVTTLNK